MNASTLSAAAAAAAATTPTTATTATTPTTESSFYSAPTRPRTAYIRTEQSLSDSVFGPSVSVNAVKDEKMLQEIKAIRQTIEELFTRLQGFQNAVWLNKVANFDQPSVVAMEDAIGKAQYDLSVRKEKICVVEQSGAIPDCLEKIQGLEVMLNNLSIETNVVQDRLGDPDYTAASVQLQQTQQECTRLITSELPMTDRVLACETLWRNIESYITKADSSSKPAVLALKIRIVQCVDPVLTRLKDGNILNTAAGQTVNDVAALSDRIIAVKTALDIRVGALRGGIVLDDRFAPEQKLTVEQLKQFASNERLKQLASNPAAVPRFTVIEPIGTFAGWRYREYYKRTNELLNRFKPVVDAVSALVSSITLRTQCLAKAKLTQDETATKLQAELNSYIDVIKTCSFEIEQHLEAIRSYPGTDKTYEVENHIAEIQQGLEEQKRALHGLEEMMSGDYIQIAGAQKALIQFLRPTPGDMRFHLYHAAKAIEPHTPKLKLPDTLPTPPFPQQFCTSTVSALFKILEKKGPAGLELTELEGQVWQTLFGQKDLLSLRLTPPEPGCMPQAVRRFIEKRITQFLFIPSASAAGEVSLAELELVLYILEKDRDYAPIFTRARREDPEFDEIILAYEGSKVCTDERLSEELRGLAATVCRLIEISEIDKKVTQYAELWQAFEQFQARAEADGKKPDVVLRMRQFLYKRITQFTAGSVYFVPPDCSQKEKLADLVRQASLKEILSSYLLPEKREVFFRALASGIYALNCEEKSHGQKIVREYLDQPDAAFSDLISDFEVDEFDFWSLIHELSLRQIIGEKFTLLSERAMKKFIEEPVTAYLTDPQRRLYDPRLALALGQLLVYEDGKPIQPVTKLVVEQLGTRQARAFLDAAKEMASNRIKESITEVV